MLNYLSLGLLNLALSTAKCPSQIFRSCTIYTDETCSQEARTPRGEKQDDYIKNELARWFNSMYENSADTCDKFAPLNWKFLIGSEKAKTECFDDHIQTFFYKSYYCKDETKFTPMIPDTYFGPAILHEFNVCTYTFG